MKHSRRRSTRSAETIPPRRAPPLASLQVRSRAMIVRELARPMPNFFRLVPRSISLGARTKSPTSRRSCGCTTAGAASDTGRPVGPFFGAERVFAASVSAVQPEGRAAGARRLIQRPALGLVFRVRGDPTTTAQFRRAPHFVEDRRAGGHRCVRFGRYNAQSRSARTVEQLRVVAEGLTLAPSAALDGPGPDRYRPGPCPRLTPARWEARRPRGPAPPPSRLQQRPRRLPPRSPSSARGAAAP